MPPRQQYKVCRQRERERERERDIARCLALYPGPSHPDGKWAWYPLFAHACNLPEILVNRELSCYIRALITSYSVMSPLTVSCHEFIT